MGLEGVGRPLDRVNRRCENIYLVYVKLTKILNIPLLMWGIPSKLIEPLRTLT